ncbi:hypothetical protein TNCV_816911 [Trichonephila clavipes]|nr:hypothetical protein TNCV_816911 [Trichonephila clavipes]
MDIEVLLKKKKNIKSSITKLQNKTEEEIEKLNNVGLLARKNRFLEFRTEIKDILDSIISGKWQVAYIIKMGRTILLERRQSESVGRRNSRTTFLRSDWPRPFARREVGVEMELGRSENKRPEQRRS